MPKAPFISYSCISYFGHACLNLNIVSISLLTGKCATQNLKNVRNSCVWTCSHIMDMYQRAKIKKRISA